MKKNLSTILLAALCVLCVSAKRPEQIQQKVKTDAPASKLTAEIKADCYEMDIKKALNNAALSFQNRMTAREDRFKAESAEVTKP